MNASRGRATVGVAPERAWIVAGSVRLSALRDEPRRQSAARCASSGPLWPCHPPYRYELSTGPQSTVRLVRSSSCV
eukprot:6913362-Prymnesium_polylepis.1